VDLAAIYAAGDCWGCELRFLWLDDWTAAARTANPSLIDIDTDTATGPWATTTFESLYRSELYTVETNARRAVGKSTLLCGFRYALLDDELLIRGTGGAPNTNARFAAQNDLFGLQLGVAHDWRSHCESWGVGGFARVGAYYNAINTGAALAIGGAPVGMANDTDASLAFLGEAGINATWRVRQHLMLRVGYRVLVVDGVAIAAEQVDRTSALQLPNPTISAHDGGTLFAHGLHAGVEMAW
jgi:hypothetical protein